MRFLAGSTEQVSGFVKGNRPAGRCCGLAVLDAMRPGREMTPGEWAEE
jgi:hypothetical protein